VGGWSQRNQRSFVMNQTNEWMGGRTGGGMWLWAVIGVAVAVLLVVVIAKLSKK
jgi:predicted metalloprotease